MKADIWRFRWSYRENGLQVTQDGVARRTVRERVASDIARDVGDEIVEVGDLEELVECDQLEVDNPFFTDDRLRRPVGQSPVGILFDNLPLRRAGVWKPIWQLVTRWWHLLGRSGSCDDGRSQAQESDSFVEEMHRDEDVSCGNDWSAMVILMESDVKERKVGG